MVRRVFAPIALVAVLAILVGGCTSHSGQRVREGITERVVLEANNFSLVSTHVQGEAACPYLFYHGAVTLPVVGTILPRGGIALGEPELYEKAMANLHGQYDQMEGQPALFHNIQEEWTVTGLPPLYAEVTLTLTADVLQFTGDYVDYATR